MQVFKKLVEFSVKINLRQKFIIHQINNFWIEKTIDMWAEISLSFALDQDQHYHILVELDFYFMIDLISILFVKSLNIFLCMRKKHQHVVFDFENVNEINSVIYKIYYL